MLDQAAVSGIRLSEVKSSPHRAAPLECRISFHVFIICQQSLRI